MNLMWIMMFMMVMLVAGIIYLAAQSPVKNRSREEFLKTLAGYMDGKLEPFEPGSHSYRITFRYEGQEFVYEDMESTGFYSKVYKTCVRTNSMSNVTLQFTEKRHKKMINTELVMVSEMIYEDEPSAEQHIRVALPKDLSIFNVVTNDPLQVNKLLKDPKVLRTFSEFKNVDPRGHPFMALNIDRGELVLEFHPSGTFNPRPLILHYNMRAFEDYLQKLIVVVEKLRFG